MKEIINDYEIKKTPAELAFQWLWAQSGVKVVLSGMNDEKHIKGNIRFASKEKNNRLTKKEKEIIEKLKKEFKSKMKIDCTSCGYCIPCPYGVDIPICFSSYNDKKMFGGLMPQIMYLTATKYESGAHKCRKCGICEKKCPQNIAIVDELKNVSKAMDHWYYRTLGKVIRAFIFR
jgi:predicted aldo/keto reductase-like oxidoreductase